MVNWKRNLAVLCFVQLVTMIGFSGFFPFVAYHLMDLGITDTDQAATYLAIFNSGNAAAMMIAAPIWGAIADKHGRRMMLIRATAAGCIFTFLMGAAQSPQQLIIARIIQGAFSGTVAAAVTLVSTETPDQYLARSLGIVQTAQFIGQTVGPLLGGYAADSFGYKNVFYLSSALILLSVFATIAFVRETKRAKVAPEPRRRRSLKEAIAALGNRNTVILVITLAGNSFAIAVLSPVLSLYIKALIGNVPNLATIAGWVMSVAAFSSSLSAVLLGRLADKLGQKKILVACVLGIALIHIPQAMVSTPGQLVFLRAVQGLFMGGIMPTANALLARSTASSHRGAVFGFAHSAQAGGRSLGPILCAGVANAWGMPSAFLVTATVFGIMSLLVTLFVHTSEAAAEEVPPAQAA